MQNINQLAQPFRNPGRTSQFFYKSIRHQGRTNQSYHKLSHHSGRTTQSFHKSICHPRRTAQSTRSLLCQNFPQVIHLISYLNEVNLLIVHSTLRIPATRRAKKITRTKLFLCSLPLRKTKSFSPSDNAQPQDS